MTRKTYKVQKCIALAGKLPSGVRVGKIWQTIATKRNRAVAERVAQLARTDDHDHQVRIIEQ